MPTTLTISSRNVVYSDPVVLPATPPSYIIVSASKYGIPSNSDMVKWGFVDLVYAQSGFEDYRASFDVFPWYGYSAGRMIKFPVYSPGSVWARLWPSAQTVGKTITLDVQLIT